MTVVATLCTASICSAKLLLGNCAKEMLAGDGAIWSTQLNMRRTSKPAETKMKWLKLRMSRSTVLCYGQTTYQDGLFIAMCHISKNPTYSAELSKFGCVTSSLLNCDELTVWRVGCTLRVDCDELTIWRVESADRDKLSITVYNLSHAKWGI